MGARTFEAGLRLRVLVFLAPLLLAVGASLLVITSHVLGDLEARAARERGDAALRMLDDELAEGDAIDLAMREVLVAADADRLPMILRSAAGAVERTGGGRMPPSLTSLDSDRCATGLDEHAAAWVACARGNGRFVAVVARPMDRARDALALLALATLGVIAIALLGAAFAIRSTVRRSTRDVQALAAWSRGVAASAKPSPAPNGESLELAQLSAAFDDLVHRLFDALERQRAQNAHIAHELRTPLTSIRAELESLAREPGGAAVRALGDVDRLRGVIDAILVLSMPRDAKVSHSTVNLADIAREHASRDMTVEAPDEALVKGDAHLLTLALVNLLENAAKHGGGARGIRVKREGESVRMTVFDSGAGIADGLHDRMFERYWRGTADGDGMGLGLALVRAVAERHGGRAVAEARSPRGLEVSIVIPNVVYWNDSESARASR